MNENKNLELLNFFKMLRYQPFYVLHYLFDFLRTYCSRTALMIIGNVINLFAPHRGLKLWPAWLGTRSLPRDSMPQENLFFPQFPKRSNLSFKLNKWIIKFDEKDFEGLLAQHRWHVCLFAALGDSGKASAAFHQAMSWMRKPIARRTAAWEPYSTSERIANLAILISVFPSLFQRLNKKNRTLIADFFLASATWIHDHLEFYDDERINNHILNNARALVIAGVVLGNAPLARRGIALFYQVAKVLFTPTGALRERSTHYQLVVANWVADVAKFSGSASFFGIEESHMIRHIKALAKKSGRIALLLGQAAEKFCSEIGDLSPDYHPYLSRFRLQRLYPEIDTATEDKTGTVTLGDWILGRSGMHSWMTFEFPMKYPLKYATHGHSDLGHFLWAYKGKPILVDSGRSTYQRGELGTLQCSARAHNTLMINGLPAVSEPLLHRGRWLPQPYSEATIHTKSDQAGFVLQHDGFSRIPGVGSHRRTVSFTRENEIIITDKIEGTAEVAVAQYWHFFPDWQTTENLALRHKTSGARLIIHVDGVKPTPETRWEAFPYSVYYGNRGTCQELTLVLKISLPGCSFIRMRIY